MAYRNSNMDSVWSKFMSFAKKLFTGILIFGCIIYIGLHNSIKGFFSFLSWLTRLPYIFLEVSLNILHFLDLRVSEGLIKFIGFVTPRSEFFAISLYMIISVLLLMLKIFVYFIFFFLKMLSFFPWFLKVACFAIFVPPLVYGYDLCSFIIYYTKTLYYAILGCFYKTLKVCMRSYLALLEISLLSQYVAKNGRKLVLREAVRVIFNVAKRFRFEQFGNISSSKVGNYYYNSDTFDLDQYFLGPIPYSVYVSGRHAHEHSKFHSVHRLVHDSRFFYQPAKKRKLLRFNYSTNKLKTVLEEPAYNAVRVFEYHRYISMGLVRNFNFSSFPEYYRSKLFSRLLRYNLIPAVNFFYNIFSSTLRNKNKNPDFWVNYRKVVINSVQEPVWFEYSRNLLLKDPVFSYNNYDYSSPRFGRKLTNRSVIKNRFREFSISEGSRFSFDDYRSSADISGKPFVGSHFSQFVDDYDHYLKTSVHYKSKMERFWFKRVILPDSGLALDYRFGLPSLVSADRYSLTYKRQFKPFIKIILIGFFGGITALYIFFMKALLISYKFFISFLSQLGQFVSDFLFRAYLSFVFFILQIPSLAVRGKHKFVPVHEFFSYPVKVSPFSVLWAVTVFSISLFRTLISILCWFYIKVCRAILRIYNFVMLPLDFMKFLIVCAKEGNLESFVAYEMDALHKETDDFVEWLLNDSDK